MEDVLYAYEDYWQKRCYKCGSAGHVRHIRHTGLYNVVCSNPNCGNVTSRDYLWRSSAVEAWNKGPDIWGRLYDKFLEKFVDKISGKS